MAQEQGSKASLGQRWLGVAAQLGPLLAVAGVLGLFAAAEALFTERANLLGVESLRAIIVNSTTVGVCALGMTLLIIAGGIDLSVGSGMALCATALACLLKRDCNPVLAVTITLAIGGLLGAINGCLVSFLRIVPFIITLGTMTIYVGAGKMLAENVEKGQTVRPAEDQVPRTLRLMIHTRREALYPPAPPPPSDPKERRAWVEPWWTTLPGPVRLPWCTVACVPLGVWLALILAAGVSGLLHWTVFGRYIYALGSNESTARLCGINVPLTRIAIYTVSGLFVGMAGVLWFCRLASGTPTSGSGQELKVIAAVVIGGASLSGGRGSVIGTLAGALLMNIISSGCTQLGLSNEVQDMVLGGVIIGCVTMDQVRQHGAEIRRVVFDRLGWRTSEA